MTHQKPRRIFVSHSTKDRDFVETEIIALLRRHGIETWYSKDDIKTASQWHDSIVDGLKSCDWFLVAISSRSISSKWVRAEVDWAFQHRLDRFVPLILEACQWDEFNLLLRTVQNVDFTSNLDQARCRLMETWGITVDQISDMTTTSGPRNTWNLQEATPGKGDTVLKAPLRTSLLEVLKTHAALIALIVVMLLGLANVPQPENNTTPTMGPPQVHKRVRVISHTQGFEDTSGKQSEFAKVVPQGATGEVIERDEDRRDLCRIRLDKPIGVEVWVSDSDLLLIEK